MNAARINLLLITFLTEASMFGVIFAVSRTLGEVDTPLLDMGLIGGGFFAAFSISSFLSGRFSDRFGRRRFMLGGMCLMLVTTIACAWLDRQHPAYYWIYCIMGFGPGCVYPSVIAWLTRNNNEQAATGRISHVLIAFCLTWNAAIVCSQSVGGWLFGIDERLPIWLAAGLAVVNIAVLAMIGPSRSHTVVHSEASEPGVQRHRMRSATFMQLAWLANLGGTFCMGIVVNLLPDLAVSEKIGSDLHGYMLAGMRGVVIATYLVLYFSRFWHHRFTAAVVSQAVAMGGLIVVANADSVWVLCLGLAALGQLAGYNYLAGLHYSTSGSVDERRGAASGMHEATLTMGMAAGSICGGLIAAAAGPRAPYMLAAGVVGLLAIAQAIMYAAHRASASANDGDATAS